MFTNSYIEFLIECMCVRACVCAVVKENSYSKKTHTKTLTLKIEKTSLTIFLSYMFIVRTHVSH